MIPPMNSKKAALNWLIPAIGFLALLSSAAGLLWPGGEGTFQFSTLRGTSVEMSGQGLYRFDSLFTSGSFLGADIVTLALGIPLLAVGYILFRRNSKRGTFLLAGVLSFLLYNSASMAFGAAYNQLFLVYIVFFAAALFGFILSIQALDVRTLSDYISPRMPRRGIAVFLFITAGILAFVWLSDLLGSMIEGKAPDLLGPYTTMITYIIDLGVILPVIILAGVLLLRQSPFGYPLSFIMLFLCALIGVLVAAQTVMQIRIGITYTREQIVIFISSFIVMSLFACWLTVVFLRHVAKRDEWKRTPKLEV